METPPTELEKLLQESDSSDYYEEEAEEYLQKQNIQVTSHNRRALYTKAWNTGWRPN
jgi:hypothetical protein